MLIAAQRFTVIDEADELLSTGWEEAMEKLFQGSGKFYLTYMRRHI